MAPQRKKILLVDDSSLVIRMEQMIIPSSKYVVTVARDGQEGVQRAITDQPDLIVMDVVMPIMTGFEAVAALRANDETKDIPVIMVTTKGDAKSVEAGFSSGCNDYITKPIDSLELLSKIKNLIGD